MTYSDIYIAELLKQVKSTTDPQLFDALFLVYVQRCRARIRAASAYTHVPQPSPDIPFA
ncbi:hypothetical protein [Tellurirhabdus rosea]|uniref:hypothetical protein n=1 Tax=Tellurirhabdus rosea TaxID=2674997 RepID=UPI00225A405D|nr:hypothetical protein [Tellurirhabdus rosea]